MLRAIASRLESSLPFGIAVLCFLMAAALLSLPRNLSRSRPRTLIVLLLSCAVFVAMSVGFRKYLVDDAYISLRYARNLANGYGLVFSTDGKAPIEGYTNFLWVLLEAPLFLLKLPVGVTLVAVKLMGIGFGLGTIIVAYLMARLITDSIRVGLIASLLLSAVPYLSFWAVGGLETTMYVFWLMLGLYSYVVEVRQSRMHFWSMLWFTLLALTRPEGLVLALGILVYDLATNAVGSDQPVLPRRLRLALPGALLFILALGAYFIWRYNFYGFPLPNTFYARSGTIGVHQLYSRLTQMWPFIAYLLPIGTIACLGFLRLLEMRGREALMLTSGALALLAFGFAAKNEWMPGFRYELPSVAVLIPLCSAGLDMMLVQNAEGQRWRWAAGGARLCMLTLLGMFLLHPATKLNVNQYYTNGLNRAHVALGKWLKQYAPRGASYAGWDMGAVPFYSELPSIIEIYPEGILSTHTTHVGYEIAYFLSLSPSFVVLPPEPNPKRSDGMYAFYSSVEFRQTYQPLFTFAFTPSYLLAVYRRRDVAISQEGIIEGERLAERSVSEANADIR